MSVAFRRESDEEHKEPRPDLPIPPGPNLVTARGLAMIEAKAAAFEAALETALADKASDEAVAAIRRDLRYWHSRRASAQPTQPPKGDEAGFGSLVTYRLDGDAPRTVRIVGEDEADPASGLIAVSSPLARALIGSGAGDVNDFADRSDAIEIVAVVQESAPLAAPGTA